MAGTTVRRFRDRAEAGRLLAERLREYAGRDDVVVLGLPRGGVPVAIFVHRLQQMSRDRTSSHSRRPSSLSHPSEAVTV
jgi:hypothetical protein